MILMQSSIRGYLKNREIQINPFDEIYLEETGYQLTLDEFLLVHVNSSIDLRKGSIYKPLTIPQSGLQLMPGILYLGASRETIDCGGFVPSVSPLLSLSKLGVEVIGGTTFGDPGFVGSWQFCFKVSLPTLFYPKIPFAKLSFHLTSSVPKRSYSLNQRSHYNTGSGPMPSSYHLKL